MAEDFGGDEPQTPAQLKAKSRADKASRGECRECSRKVKIKSNGRPGKLCEVHADADAKRKRTGGNAAR